MIIYKAKKKTWPKWILGAIIFISVFIVSGKKATAMSHK